MLKQATFFLVVCLFPFPSTLFAQSQRQSKLAELKVCTQNLDNYLTKRKAKHKYVQEIKEQELISGFIENNCDVIAVQEVGGIDTSHAQLLLDNLAKKLSNERGYEFKAVVGETNDEYIRNGFIISTKNIELLTVQSYHRRSVAKLQTFGPTRRFARGPLLVKLLVQGQEGAKAREVFLITDHLKSKAGSWKDPTKTEFESFRMEMAETLREISLEQLSKSSKDAVMIILGDFNSDAQSAAIDILIGRYYLSNFKSKPGCSVNESLKASCEVEFKHAQVFYPILSSIRNRSGRPDQYYSYRYKNKLELIDDIFIDFSNIWIVADDSGSEVAGIASINTKASDHGLLWAELNW